MHQFIPRAAASFSFIFHLQSIGVALHAVAGQPFSGTVGYIPQQLEAGQLLYVNIRTVIVSTITVSRS